MKCQFSRSGSSKPKEALVSWSFESVPRNFCAAWNIALPEAAGVLPWANRMAPIVTATRSETANRIERACMAVFLACCRGFFGEGETASVGRAEGVTSSEYDLAWGPFEGA